MLHVCVYVRRSDPDESRFNHNCAFEAGALPYDIKGKVLPDGSYSVAFIQISLKYQQDISLLQRRNVGMIFQTKGQKQFIK